jgi:hypothetical protein
VAEWEGKPAVQQGICIERPAGQLRFVRHQVFASKIEYASIFLLKKSGMVKKRG